MDLFYQPWKMLPNPIRGVGGREIDRFRGICPPKDISKGSEEWVASDTNVNGSTSQNPYFGHSRVILPNGRIMYISEAISMDPENILGITHVEKYGARLGILVKLLDAKEQYLLQCHPSRQIAKTLWGNDYGKEESWYIVQLREDVEEPPYIFLGFKEGISKEIFKRYFKAGNLTALEQLCHKIPVEVGDAYFVPSGVPHALGKGCLAVEIQEPSDITAVPISQDELISFRQKALPDALFIEEDNTEYEKKTLNSFRYSGSSMQNVIDRNKSKKVIIRKNKCFTETLLIGREHTKYFTWTRADINGTMGMQNIGGICIAIILSGSGKILSVGRELQIKQGDVIFFPYNACNSKIQGRVSAIFCSPG
jgi:mannose-6-phosphate isomerase